MQDNIYLLPIQRYVIKVWFNVGSNKYQQRQKIGQCHKGVSTICDPDLYHNRVVLQWCWNIHASSTDEVSKFESLERELQITAIIARLKAIWRDKNFCLSKFSSLDMSIFRYACERYTFTAERPIEYLELMMTFSFLSLHHISSGSG